MTKKFIFAAKTEYNSDLYKFAWEHPSDLIRVAAPGGKDDGRRMLGIEVVDTHVLTIGVTDLYTGRSEWCAVTPEFVDTVAESTASERVTHPLTKDVQIVTFALTPVDQAVHTQGGRFYRGHGERWIVRHYPSDVVPTKDELGDGTWERKLAEKKETERALAEQRAWFSSRNVLIWFYRKMSDGTSVIRYDHYEKGVRVRVPGVLEDEQIVCPTTSSPTHDQEKIATLISSAFETGELDEIFLKETVLMYADSTRAVILKRMGIIPTSFA